MLKNNVIERLKKENKKLRKALKEERKIHELKELINFPQSKDFDITIFNDSILNNVILTYNPSTPSNSDRINTLTYSKNLITITRCFYTIMHLSEKI